ncbi:MAG: GNAT family N-acetyltransferase [Clostridia bacterium]|nr:GNAT family N-acetyltransferase [Clostridia bacterium]
MLEIKDIAVFNEKVKAFTGAYPEMVTNCFLMPSEIIALAAEGRLFIEEFPEWLLILCDREDYSNLYYYTTDTSDVAFVKQFMKNTCGREVYMDAVSRMGRGDSETPKRLVKEGAAERYKTYQRMQLPVKNIDFDSFSFSVPVGYTVSTDYCDYEKLTALWKETLDEKSTPLPKQEELFRLREEENLFTVLNNHGELAAVLILSVSSKQGLIQHIAVSSEERRKGLAANLMKKSFFAAREKGLTMLRLWVDCKNTAAITLYDRFDFKQDGMICEQLYMKG